MTEAVYIKVHVSDRIGLPKFSSVEISAGLEKTVNVESDEELTQVFKDTFKYLEEDILAEERQKVLDGLSEE